MIDPRLFGRIVILSIVITSSASNSKAQDTGKQARSPAKGDPKVEAAIAKDRQLKRVHFQSTGKDYKNKSMGFSTKLPDDWKVSELGERAMRASLSKADDYLSFAATASDIDERVSLDMFYQQSLQHLPPDWSLKFQERTSLDGVPAIAMEIAEHRGPAEMYRQRIFLVHQKKLFTFDILCPSADKTKNNALIKAIWSNLRFI